MTARRQEAITVALVNNKGGVGKTTSAVNLAAGLAGWMRAVLTENEKAALRDLTRQN